MKILKKISKVIVIVMAVLATIWCGLYVYANYFYNDKQIDVENFYIAELPLPPSQFEEDFKEIHQIVMENYSLYQAKHLNMDSLYQACDARVRQAQTTTDYGLIVQEYISALQCAHAITCYKRYTANQRVAFIEDSLFVDKPSDYLTEYGFQDKDRIIAINGLPYKQWIEQNEKYTEASTVPHRRLRTAYDAFRSYADTLRNYTLLRGGDTLTITLPLKQRDYFPDSEEQTVESRILQDSIGYLTIKTMMNPVMEDFKAVYPKVKDLPYLIIDVRRNGGGNSMNGVDICKYFIREAQPHCVSKNYIMQPETDAYKGKIYLLTDTYTLSAAESFTLDMKESGNVTLIGEATGGDTGNGPRPFCTKQRTYFRIPTRQPDVSSKGFPMEGIGIPPHHQSAPYPTQRLRRRLRLRAERYGNRSIQTRIAMLKRALFFSTPFCLSLRDNQLVIATKEAPNLRKSVPIEDIGVVVLEHQQTTVTLPLLNALSDRNVAVVFCDGNRMPNAMLMNLDSNRTQGESYRAQIEASEPLKKNLWKQIVEAKIRNQAALLRKLGKDGDKLKPSYKNVKSGDADNREGAAARIYWSELFGKEFVRIREGAEPNNLLNYGYTILRAAVARSLMGSGLFPAFGIFHRNRYNAFPLADDVMEPYRPYVDELVCRLYLENKTQLTQAVKGELLSLLYADTRFEKVLRPLDVGLTFTSASLAQCFTGMRKKIAFPLLE